MLKSYLKLTFPILAFILMSCEDCLDMQTINQRTEEIQSWVTDSEIISKTATSTLQISDEVQLIHNTREASDIIWDNCDNVTQTFSHFTDYVFFNFPFDIKTEFYKQGEEEGFEFIVLYNDKKLIYNFARQSSTDNSIQILQDVDIENQFYEELLEILFEFNSENEINKIYLAKQIGIVKIILNNGTEIFLTAV